MHSFTVNIASDVVCDDGDLIWSNYFTLKNGLINKNDVSVILKVRKK